MKRTVDTKVKNISRFDLNEMHKLIVSAVEKTYHNEWFLIEHQLSEWTVAFSVAYYLRKDCEGFLGEYSIDAEYNHAALINPNRESWKKLVGGRMGVRPDIIIHRRGFKYRAENATSEDADCPNVLWVELKRHGGKPVDEDCKNKLEHVTATTFVDLEAVTGYKYGLSLLLMKTRVECRWYMGGHPVSFQFGKVVKESSCDALIKWANEN